MMTKSKTLNLGFIGGGINSAIGKTHEIATHIDHKFKLVSGCFSTNKDKNQETADKWSIDRYYNNFEEFLENERNQIDAIVILTPTDQHTEYIIRSIENTIPVICEKTLTDNIEDAYKIKKAIDANNGFLAVTYNYTGYPMVREMQHMIEIGKLGKIIQINIQMPQESFIRLDKNGGKPSPQKWRLHDKEISMISLDLGTHLTNMIYFLTNEHPLEVVALGNSFGHFNVTDNIIALAKYTNNIDCHIWYSKSALGHKNGLKVEVYGTEGSLSWYQMNPEFLQFNDNEGRNIILDRSSKDIHIADQERYNRFKSGHPAGFIEAFANHYEDIHASLTTYLKTFNHETTNYVFGIDQSLESLATMVAIEKSIKCKQWVKVGL